MFALTDSLVKVSSMSQLRLENYLFTVGVRPRRGLLLRRVVIWSCTTTIASGGSAQDPPAMVQQATGRSSGPCFEVMTSWAGGQRGRRPLGGGFQPTLDLPTDNWPFLYLVERGIPKIYGWACSAWACSSAC